MSLAACSYIQNNVKTILGTNMKINEYNQMMNYLTRPGKVLQNNINDKKFNAIEARTALKRGGSDTKPTPKNNKMLEYIDDINIIYGDKKATNAEKDAAANRQKLREATPEQLGKLQKRLDNARAFVTPPKDKMSKQDEYNTYFNKKSPKYYKAEKPKPSKPKPIPFPQSADEFMELNDMLDAIDPSWWLPDDDKKVEAESLYEKYLELLKAGELLPGTSFELFEKNYLDFDTDVISKINKKVREKKKAEGLAALLSLSPDRI